MNDKQIALKVSKTTILVNCGLSILKLFTGIITTSGAMISDAIHSISDVLSTFIVMLGINLSNKESDASHPYGHERLEYIASMILSFALAIVGFEIGKSGLYKILDGNYDKLKIPGLLSLIVAIISIITKEWMFQYTKKVAKQLNSDMLMADAWHHRSDSLSSIGAFIGILGSRIGFPIFDSIACVIICIFILKVAYDIFKSAVDKLVDKACDKKIIEQFKTEILNNKDIKRIDSIKTRLFGNKIYIELELAVDTNISVKQGHYIAEKVHDDLENKFLDIKHCTVHINPYE